MVRVRAMRRRSGHAGGGGCSRLGQCSGWCDVLGAQGWGGAQGKEISKLGDAGLGVMARTRGYLDLEMQGVLLSLGG